MPQGRKCANPQCGKPLSSGQKKYCSRECLKTSYPSRNCQNVACGKPLTSKQKSFCSPACLHASQRSPIAEKVWALRAAHPEMQLIDIAAELDIKVGQVNSALYLRKDIPSSVPTRKYQKRPSDAPARHCANPDCGKVLGNYQKKYCCKACQGAVQKKPPPPPEEYPPGKWGKYPAPGWLWRGGETLEQKYPQFAEKKKK